MNGLCECGCGHQTEISRYTDRRRGQVQGEPKRYISGHRSGTGEKNQNWKGGI